jgi:oxygen-independent coproporphyrinogen III oxidase
MAEFLYIHIPFCKRKCLYCDFLSVPHENVLAERYIDALCTELTLRKNSTGPLKAVYVGGGTPSILSESCFRKLFDCLKDNLLFSPGIEITVEANPGTLTQSGIHTMLSTGVNRISIGVQSLHDRELKTLGRIHSGDDAKRSVGLIRRSGVRNYSLDLMYGIPGQTLRTWRETLTAAIDLSPAHISAYELTPEKGTPIYDLISSGAVSLPDEEMIIEMYEYAIDYLASAGYDHYEISNFALPGARCVHNMNYWDRGDYVGVGAGAHSFIDRVRSANTDSIEKYISCLNARLVPAGEPHTVSTAEASREFLFLGLRKREGIWIGEAAGRGIDIVPRCREMFDRGYLTLNGTHVGLTRKGLVVSNAVIVRLFELLGL